LNVWAPVNGSCRVLRGLTGKRGVSRIKLRERDGCLKNIHFRGVKKSFKWRRKRGVAATIKKKVEE